MNEFLGTDDDGTAVFKCKKCGKVFIEEEEHDCEVVE